MICQQKAPKKCARTMGCFVHGGSLIAKLTRTMDHYVQR